MGSDEGIDEGVLRWFSHAEKMGNDRVYVGEFASSRSMGRLRKRWTDIVKDCLRKISLAVRQTRIMVQDRGECWGF